MKCPKCGFITSDLKKQCMRCGSALPGKGEARDNPAPAAAPPAPAPPQPAVAPTGSEVPEWRKQVTQKVREYGERKKLLTTPPGPIKETPPEELSFPAEPELVERAQSAQPAAPNPAPAVREPRAPVPEPPAPRPDPEPRSVELPVDVAPEDFMDFEQEEEEPEGEASPARRPLLLGRRLVSLLLDNMLLVVLHSALIYLVAQIISFQFLDLVRVAVVPLAAIFLLFHFVYYAYFYKTSRQTPGQVFFGIELRDPLSAQISTGKIAVRWLCLVVLNVLNLLPALAGKPLLLDQISKTEIKTLR